MSDYRVFERNSVGGFNGTTLDAATYTASGFLRTTTTTTAVGLFSPAGLGRLNNVASLIQVQMQGTVLGTDVLRIVGTDNQVRKSVVLSTDVTPWVFAGPLDRVGIVCAGGTQANIIVNDLTDEQLQTWINSTTCCSSPSLPLPQREIEVTATQSLPAYDGHLIVNLDCPLDADIELPALADTTPGLCSITAIRIGNVGDPRIIPEDAADQVNGRAGIVANEYYLRSIGDAVTYFRVEAGWAMEFGDQARTQVSSNLNPIQIPSCRSGTLYVIDTAAVLDNQASLPPLGNGTEGIRIALVNSDTQRHQVVPQVGDLLNTVLNGVRYVGPKQVVIAEETPSGWYAYGGGNQGLNISSAANVVLTAQQISGGITTVTTTGGAAQSVTLPLSTTVAPGTIVVHYNSSGNTHTDNPTGADLINGANANVNLATTKRTFLIAMGGTTGWVTILGA